MNTIPEPASLSRRRWNRVPEITLMFWAIKMLATTVGETAADYLNENVGLGLTNTMWVMIAVLATALAVQFSRRRYVAGPYWVAVLFTFALGTAGGIGLVYLAHRMLGLGAIAAFWIAYVLTRPPGASIGDSLSRGRVDGGLGLGTTVTSALFLVTILGLVSHLAVTRIDRGEPRDAAVLGS